MLETAPWNHDSDIVSRETLCALKCVIVNLVYSFANTMSASTDSELFHTYSVVCSKSLQTTL
jgi:hypothetical protein